MSNKDKAKNDVIEQSCIFDCDDMAQFSKFF